MAEHYRIPAETHRTLSGVFPMPGHKGSELYRRLGYGDFLEHIMDCDITEIPGADNLFQTEGIIRETQEKYQNLYGVKKSYLLINGTSGGLIAGILASVEPGGSLILARNCHKAVFNALTLGNIKPVYAYPEEEARYGIAGVTTADEIDRLMREHPEARAVVLPSPNYYGICSDIAGIAETVHSRRDPHRGSGPWSSFEIHERSTCSSRGLRSRHHRGQYSQNIGIFHTKCSASCKFRADQSAGSGRSAAEDRKYQPFLSSHGFTGSKWRYHEGARNIPFHTVAGKS